MWLRKLSIEMSRHRTQPKLPANLRREESGYYYRDPYSRRDYFVSKIRSIAIEQASRANLIVRMPGGHRYIDARAIHGLMPESYIAKQAMPLPLTCGIYFLVHAGRVVYVGQSLNCYARVNEHVFSGGKVFDSFYVLAVDEQHLDFVETLYIAHLGPPYNVVKKRKNGRLLEVVSREHLEYLKTINSYSKSLEIT